MGEGEGEPLWVVHHHPGRLRVRAPAFRQDEALVGAVRRAVDGIVGVSRSVYSATSGSLLVEYEPAEVSVGELLALLIEAGGFAGAVDESDRRRSPRAPGDAVLGGAERLSQTIAELSGGRADLRLLVPLALASVSAYSLLRGPGPRLPRWDNLLWWSYSLFTDLHRRAERDQTEPPLP
jgi:hypothetical protein